jgi:hypothetical protein
MIKKKDEITGISYYYFEGYFNDYFSTDEQWKAASHIKKMAAAHVVVQDNKLLKSAFELEQLLDRGLIGGLL